VRPRYGMGLATEAWGLVFKNLVSDVGATIYSMNKYRDPPLPAIAFGINGDNRRMSRAHTNIKR
jgi:hypothetical protein